jgi:hypothetical protein
MLWEWDLFLIEVHDRLLQAQAYDKRYYDGYHHDLECSIGDLVWLRLLHHQAASLVTHHNVKLGPCYAVSFQLKEGIDVVEYRLQLPRVLSSMTSSMLVSSSSTMMLLLSGLQNFRRWSTGASCLSP